MPRENYERVLQSLQQDALLLGSAVDKAIARAIEALNKRDIELARRIIADDDYLDTKRTEIERSALLIIATQQPIATDLRVISAVMNISSELERMGDYAEGIARITVDTISQPPISPPVAAISRMADKARDMLRRSLDAFVNRDVEQAQQIWNEDDEIDELYGRVYNDLLAAMLRDSSVIDCATRMLWVSHNLERIADRVTNICERVTFMVVGDASDLKVANILS